MMTNLSIRRLFLTLAIICCASPIYAQKAGTKYFADSTSGYRFKPLKDWNNIPIKPSLESQGVIARFASAKELNIRLPNNQVGSAPSGLYILRFETTRAATTGGQAGSLRNKVNKQASSSLDSLHKALPSLAPIRDWEGVFEKPHLEAEDEKIRKGLIAQHLIYKGPNQYAIELYIDCWTIPANDYDFCFVYILPDQVKKNKKWFKAFEKSVKSFQFIDQTDAVSKVGQGGSYTEQFEYHKTLAEKVTGWTAHPTPGKKYIIKTSSDDKNFIKDVITRLEQSRAVFEKDFPPSDEMTHVSVVRLCKNRDEFSKYGNTSPGTAGYFNPGSTELVLYDSKNRDRRETLAVMSHEAFHQYCHFLFDQSAAHRWFDEGHGDYYGSFEFKGKKANATAHMPGGLDRFQGIKTLVREETYKPLAQHLNADHPTWQNQGPGNTSCYEQSWSIVYMLRQGALGNLPKKVWKKEYGNIIPNYIKVLNDGFAREYKKIRDGAKEEQKFLDPKKNYKEWERLESFQASPSRWLQVADRDKIWKDAMEASWGQIDLDEFESTWLMFVRKYLK
ncbi:MAG: hypothetical protein HOM77_07300 [Planctomycetes bacterium]|nr:hypothetical protein [Planctomycetota bacterium]